MELSKDIIDKFVDLTTNKNSDTINNSLLYGKVTNIQNGGYFVQLDGSSVETPVEVSMDCAIGDRVIVTIDNHTATVTGNLSSPAAASVGAKYMVMTENGLEIGDRSTGEFDGYICRVSGDSFSITDSKMNNTMAEFKSDGVYLYDSSGTIVGSFTDKEISLGSDDTATISLIGKRNYIAHEDVSETSGDDYSQALVICANEPYDTNRTPSIVVEASNYDWDEEGKRLPDPFTPHAGFSSSCGDTPIAVLSAYKMRDAASFNITPNDMYFEGACPFSVNKQIVQYNVQIDANSWKGVGFTLSVPDGHKVIGITHIETNHLNMLAISSFQVRPSDNYFYVGLTNKASNPVTTTKLTIKYLTINTNYLSEHTYPDKTITS